ncbi:hypothetical protein LEP1GSC173_2233 [Leptospira interrogans str. HAI1594]|nr:hypothetical protein LEP1GSC173_2233 [Leptospira interrogans str. HAI1594]
MWKLAQSTISRTNPKIAEMHTYKNFFFIFLCRAQVKYNKNRIF